MKRRTWFRLHGWCSLPVWLLFCFISLTGTVAVFSHELTWLANPAARAANPDDLPRRPLPDLVDAVHERVREAEIGWIAVLEPYLATAISITEPGKPPQLVYVNPYTAEVQAISSGITFIEFMRALHGWLLFPWHHSYSIGYYLVSGFSLLMLGALVTGLVIYKRFWRAFFRPRIRTGHGPRILLGDLHRTAGAWSIWFLAVMSLTAGWYLTQGIMWHNGKEVFEHPAPVPAEDVPVTDGSVPAMISFRDAMASAHAALPGMTPAWVTFPEHGRDHFSIAGHSGRLFYDQYSAHVFINPWTGEVSQRRHPASMNVLQTVSHVADPLHYGTIGGLWTKAIWFLFGLILTGMSVSGFVIWWQRSIGRATRPARRARQIQEGLTDGTA